MMLGGKFLARMPDPQYPTCPGWGFHSAASIMSYIKLAFVACLALLLLLFLLMLLYLYFQRISYRPQVTLSLDFNGGKGLKQLMEEVRKNLEDSDVIGMGGSGKVRRVRLRSSRMNRQYRTVAVKELPRMRNQLAEGKKIDKQFDAEVKALSNIRHPNIVTMHGCITANSTNILVYEDMKNGSLDQWLHKPRGRLDWQSRVAIILDISKGLIYMHDQGIIHRDVKSSNILLDHDFVAKVGDFGLSWILDKPGESEPASVVCGTPGHIAPEYLRNAEVSEKVDVYSFGVVLLELVTGKKPHNAGTEPGISLARWASQEYRRNKVVWEDIIDKDIQNPAFLEDMKAVFKLGLSCTSEDPLDRPAMNVVLQELSLYDRSRVKRCGKKRTTESFGAKVYRNIRGKIFERG